MINAIRLYVEFFISVLIPFTVINGVVLWFEESCDPKFGCMGVFQLMLTINVICASLAAAGVLIAHVVTKRLPEYAKFRWFLILFGVIISLLTGIASGIAHSVGVSAAVTLWLLAPFFTTIVLYRVQKYNNRNHSDRI